MKFITSGSLFIGLLLSAPELWRAWSEPSVDITSVLLRFLLSVLLASVGMSMLKSVVRSYKQGAGRSRRRAVDRLPTGGSSGSKGTR